MTLRLAAVGAIAALSAGFGVVEARAGIKPFDPVADAHVSKAKSKANFGGSKTLVVDGSPVVRSYLRFNIRGLGGAVSYATLQLTAKSASTSSLLVRRAGADHWGEKRIRFVNAPKLVGPTAKGRGVKSFRTASINVTKLVRGPGVITFVLSARGRGGATFWSSESLKGLRPRLVVGVNEAPVCDDVILLTSEDTAASGDPDCADAELDRMTYSIVSRAAHGTASVVGGKLHYVPQADHNGVDRFQYRAKDGRKLSKAMTVTVSIRGVNDAPVCAPRTLTVNEDGGGAVGHLCSDVDGDAPVVSITSGAQNGSATVVGGELRYSPNPNTNGADSFTYRARDTTLASAPATVSVFVNPVNDAPTCGNVSMTTFEDVPADVNPSCSDIDGDVLGYGIAGHGAKGTGSVVGGTLRFSPTANLNGADAFTYFASDGNANSPPATASVSITPVNDVPVCRPVPLDTPEDTPREINPNCTDAEGDALSYSIASGASKGTASISTGRLRYVPNLNQIGADSFTYRAKDGALESAAATVSVSIGAVNDAPVCSARTLTVDEDASGTATPSCTDLDGDTLTYSIVAQGTKGVASVVTGNLRYAGNLNLNGADSFTYQANDGGMSSGAATVTVTINPVNDAPVCTNVTLATNEDATGERDPVCTDVDGDALTYQTASQGTKGTASIVGGRLRYVPNANANGPDSFTYLARDAALPSVAANVAVAITPVNDAPTCAGVSLTTDEDVMGEQNPSCADIDGDTLTYSIVAQGTKGTGSVVAGKLRFVPNANANGPDTFTYRASDGAATSSAASVATTIRPVNDAPTCANVTLATDEDVLAERDPSCTDIDGDALTYSIVAQAGKGTASILAGKLRFVPNANANGADSFTYRASDGAAASSAPAAVAVTIAAVNDAPSCANVSLATDEDVMGERDPSCVDIEGDAMTYAIVAAATKGTASVVANRLRYVPNANTNGLDTFTYRASDGALQSAPATVSATVAPINDAPTCTNVGLAIDEDVIGERNPGCSDVDGNPLTYSIVAQGTKGSATVAAGRLRYDPNPDVNGLDSFTYRATDGSLPSGAATVSVTIAAVNDAPVCASVALTMSEDVTGQQDPSCTDVDGDPLTYSIAAQGTKGTASVVTNRLRYVPNPNANGADSFTYRASDGAAPSAPATASVSITAANDAPTCANAPLTTNEDTIAERDPVCADVDGDALTYSIVPPTATKGTASVLLGKLRYVPNLNANGADSFGYRATDGTLASTATVSVSISAVNDAPTCANLTMTTDEDVTAEHDPSCADVDGDPLTYAIVGPAAKGTATVVAGRLRYAPNTNSNGNDSFTYRAHDGVTNGSVGTVAVTVTAVNDAPVCSPLSLAIDEGGSGTVLPNCSDAEGASLSYSIAAQGTKGVATVDGASLRYVGNANTSGLDSFTYTANDGAGPSTPATVSVSIGAVNDPPVCNPRTLILDEDAAPATVAPLCTDPDGDPVAIYSIGTQASKGVATVEGGSLKYDSNPNANGADSFTYRASDGFLAGAPATVSVTINPVNDAPSCANVPLATSEDTMGERDPSCTDVDGDVLTYGIVAPAATSGTASVVAGKLRYVPNLNANGADSFGYRASDGSLPSPAATVSVTITPVNDAPVCQPLPLDTPEDTTKEINPSCTDIEGDPLSYTIVTGATKGTASVATGRLRYAPNLNQTGADSFTYRAQDATAGSAAATVSVSIGPLNDAPVCAGRTLTLDEDASGTTAPSCTDVDGDALTFSIAGQGTKGSASVVAGNLRYAGTLNANGTDTFTYLANDGGLPSSPAAVSVTINPVNDAPACTDTTLATTEDVMGERDPVCSDVDGDALTYQTASQGLKGTASVVAGKLRFVPSANANGPDSFTYTARDAALPSATAVVAVSIAPANDAPTCTNVSLTTDEDVAGEQNPSCTDIDGDPLTYSIAGPAANGTASIAGGKLRYISNANVTGSDSFSYRAGDGSAQSTPANVAVTITPVNDAPSCVNVALATNEDVTGERDPSCSDIDGDALTYSIVAPGSKGTASVVAGRLRYAPNANANGADSFAYRATDGAAASSSPATASVTIAAVNDAPSCANVSLTTLEDTTGERDPSCSDIDGDALTYSITGQGAKGTASVVAGKLRYAPAMNANGPDSFIYQASDGALSSGGATVSVTITAVNDAPACANVTLTTLEDTTGETDPSCTDLEGNTLTYSIVASPSKGSASVVAGKLRYTPNPSVTGTDSFTYQASDGALPSPIATVSVTITPSNDAPTCSDVALATNEDTMGERDPVCTDIDGDSLTYSIAAGATNGTASVAAGKLRYVPNANFVGGDSFMYRAGDGTTTSGPANVSVTVTQVNDSPVCPDRSLTIAEDSEGSVTPVCSDPEGDAVSLQIVGQGLKGTASVVGSSLRYVGHPNANGVDSFTYRATDGALPGAPATVSVTINQANDAPVCPPVTLATSEDTMGERDPSCTDIDGDGLTYAIVAPASQGTASVVAGKLRYVPNPNTNGADSFTYQASDGALPSGAATVSVSISPVNDAPTCADVALVTSEDTPGERDPSCADIDGDGLTFSIVAQGSKGSASVVAGKLRYVPNANATGADSFTYRASDGPLSSGPATVSVTISGVNDPPTCADVALTTSEDTVGEQNPSCADADGNPLSYSIVASGTKGTASVVAGKLRYVPNANATGGDSFTYRANDGPANSNIATVTVTITAVNDAPVCANVSLTTDEDVAGQQDPSCSDIDGDTLTYTIAGPATHGTASVVAGKLRYAPNANFNGSDSFMYRAADATTSSAATVSVTINAVNDAPSCSNFGLTTDEDTMGERDPSCTDVDGDGLTYAIVGQGSKGAASVVAGKLRYVPNPNVNGADSFTYQASDGSLSSAPATVSVTITAVNNAPTCSDASLAVTEDTIAERDPVCSDIDSGSLTYSIVAQGTKGTASVVAGKLRYVPNANVNGTDSFTYKANDGAADSNVATVSVTIAAVNDPPVAQNLSVTTPEDTAKDVALSATDVEGNPLTFSIVSAPTHGTLSGTGANRTYTPDANYNGPDSFTYRVNDSLADSNVATVSVTVTAVNDPPVAQNQSVDTPEDTPKNVTLAATDVEGNTLTFSIVASPTHGTLSGTGADRTYTPDANYNGPDSFMYKANDGADSNVATVSVAVTAVNDPPVARDLSVSTTEDVPATIVLDGTDVEGDTLTYTIVSGPTNGVLVGTGPILTYTPNLNYSGPDSFTYKVNDGNLDSTVATVTITVTPVNDPPIAQDLTSSTPEDTSKGVVLSGTDAEGDTLGFTIIKPPSHGGLFGAGASRTYTPDPNYNGPDSFTYRANDGAADSNVATVTLTVTPVNDAPTCPARTLTIAEDSEGSVTPVCADPEGDAVSLEIVGQGLKGTASVVGNSLRYLANANVNGSDSFTYRATDGSLVGAPATVSVTINPANDAPVCAAVNLATSEDTTAERDPSCTDIDGGGLTYSIVAGGSKGAASVVAGKLRYVPALNATGADTFTYGATDGGGLSSAAATVSVTIDAVNDAPTCSDVALTTSEETPAERDPSCADVDGDALTYAIVAQGSKGTASVVAGKLRYVPNLNANGADSFTYRTSDGSLTSAAATVSVTIAPVNDAPVCPAQSLTIAEDTDGSVTPVCTDAENDPISLEIVSQGVDGTASVVGSSLRFIPFVDANGPDSFTYRGRDAVLGGAPATVSVTVNAVNDEPEAVPVDTSTDKGVAKVITLAGFDFDNDPLTFRIVSLPANGDLRAGPNATDPLITPAQLPLSLTGNQVKYEPSAEFTGVSSFQFRAHDGTTLSLPAEVRINVLGSNVAPVCSNRTLNIDEDLTLTDNTVCSDADGDSLTFTRTGPTHGQLTLFDDGSFEYAPDENYNGPDSFTVLARDPSGLASALATVSITVAPANDAPSCLPFTVLATEDTAGSRFADCDDVDGHPLTYAIVGQGTKGTASVQADGRLRYVPNANENGADAFTFTVSDGVVTTGVQTAQVAITAVNDAPTCNAVPLSTPRDTPGATLPDCEDVDGDTLTYQIVDQPLNGTASVNGQQLGYVPAAGYTGPDSFTYRAGDGTLFSGPATVSVTVMP